MPVTVKVDVQGAAELARGLERMPQTSADELRRAMDTSLLLLEADQRRHVAQDTRRLMGSIHPSEITGQGANLTASVGPSTRYARFVEGKPGSKYGRPPGKAPPIKAILGWSRRHGVNPVYLAHKIAVRGTRAQPFVRPSLKNQRRKIDEVFARVGYRVIQKVIGR